MGIPNRLSPKPPGEREREHAVRRRRCRDRPCTATDRCRPLPRSGRATAARQHGPVAGPVSVPATHGCSCSGLPASTGMPIALSGTLMIRGFASPLEAAFAKASSTLPPWPTTRSWVVGSIATQHPLGIPAVSLSMSSAGIGEVAASAMVTSLWSGILSIGCGWRGSSTTRRRRCSQRALPGALGAAVRIAPRPRG